MRTIAIVALAASACAPVPLRIVAFNDFHGNLRPPSGEELGGASYFASHIQELRAASMNSVVVSAGDLIGASPLISALLKDEPTIAVFNRMLDIHAIGNHELDEGLAELKRAMGEAEFELLAANTLLADTKEPIYPPYTIRTYEGVPVAFIGLTTEDTPKFVPPVIPELSFGDEADTLARLIPELSAKGVRAIVVLLHEGGFQEGKANECIQPTGPIVDIVERMPPEVDLVISAHTHQSYVCQVAGRWVTSAGCFGRMLTAIDVSLDPSTGEVVGVVARNHWVDHRIDPDPVIERMVGEYAEKTAPLENRVVGKLSQVLSKLEGETGESPLGSVIADAHLFATKDKGAQIAFMNTGGIRADLGSEQLDVTHGMAFTTQPFGNALVTMTLTGEQIDRVLEEQWGEGSKPRFLQVSETLRYTWHESRQTGDRIDPSEILIEGRPIDPSGTYRVTANNYLAGRGVLGEGVERTPGPIDLAALEAYFGAKSPISPPPLGRIHRAP